MQDPQGFCAKEEGIAGGWGVSNPLPAQCPFQPSLVDSKSKGASVARAPSD